MNSRWTAAISLVFAATFPACALAGSPLILECTHPDVYGKPMREVILLHRLEPTGLVEGRGVHLDGMTFQISSVDEYDIRAVSRTCKSKDATSCGINLDRLTGKLTAWSTIPADKAQHLWNSQKSRVGGFEGDVTLTWTADCLVAGQRF